METYSEAVARGVEWLDAQDADWREKIDVEKLDIANVNWCILGQVFGGYWSAIDYKLGGNYGRAEILGFNVSSEKLNNAFDEYNCGHIDFETYEFAKELEYAHLENEWRKVLAA